MSKDWTPAELAAASDAMKRAGQPSYEQFCTELNSAALKQKVVKVTLADGDTITTRINGTEEDIRQHYLVGSALNTGTVNDKMVVIVAVDILDGD